MASATGIPEHQNANGGRGEEEPLLGRAGDASQQQNEPLQFNLVTGTAVIAQIGIWILTATIWASVFLNKVILFSAHPLLNSAGILLTTQAILLLQPTHTPKQKSTGTHVHAILNTTSILTLIAALVIIEYNKISHGGTHFESPHAIFGLITYIFFFLQAIVGIAQFYTPSVFGSVDKAKSVYKWHRMSGYLILVMSFVTVALATQTGFNENTLHIQLWAVVVAAVIVLIGTFPRIKKQKLGL
ncbi:MAG: hypothetical protein Q9190_003368 [Brigantiaea leucoxantha]